MVFGLSAALCLGSYWFATAPPPPATDLADRPAPEPSESHSSRYTDIPAGTQLCDVTFEIDGDGRPIPNAHVKATLNAGPSNGDWMHRQTCATDDAGTCVMAIPCEVGFISATASADGYSSANELWTDLSEEARLYLSLTSGVMLDGLVLSHDAQPLEEVRIHANNSEAFTDQTGRYEIWVKPGFTGEVEASKDGYISNSRSVSLPPDQGATLDFQLDRTRELEVYCAGLPNDSCITLLPGVLCTRIGLVFGEPCTQQDDVTSCVCPEGGAAVRGGGESVRVDESDDLVWLDFRYGGGVEGIVWFEDEPVSDCTLVLARAPEFFTEDISRGFFAGRHGACDEDGSFLIEGLKPGTWRVTVEHNGQDRSLPHVWVDDDVVDLGDIDIESGGVIYGQVTDSLTGAPVPNRPVLVAPRGEGPLAMPAGEDTTDSEGWYEITGLEPGLYRTYVVSEPWDPAYLSVDDAEEVRQDLKIGRNDLEEEMGWSLVTGGNGELAVDEVHTDGVAAELGLAPGDVIEGVRLFGLDLASVHPDLPQKALQYYGGAGLTLEINRNGRGLDVDI